MVRNIFFYMFLLFAFNVDALEFPAEKDTKPPLHMTSQMWSDMLDRTIQEKKVRVYDSDGYALFLNSSVQGKVKSPGEITIETSEGQKIFSAVMRTPNDVLGIFKFPTHQYFVQIFEEGRQERSIEKALNVFTCFAKALFLSFKESRYFEESASILIYVPPMDDEIVRVFTVELGLFTEINPSLNFFSKMKVDLDGKKMIRWTIDPRSRKIPLESHLPPERPSLKFDNYPRDLQEELLKELVAASAAFFDLVHNRGETTKGASLRSEDIPDQPSSERPSSSNHLDLTATCRDLEIKSLKEHVSTSSNLFSKIEVDPIHNRRKIIQWGLHSGKTPLESQLPSERPLLKSDSYRRDRKIESLKERVARKKMEQQRQEMEKQRQEEEVQREKNLRKMLKLYEEVLPDLKKIQSSIKNLEGQQSPFRWGEYERHARSFKIGRPFPTYFKDPLHCPVHKEGWYLSWWPDIIEKYQILVNMHHALGSSFQRDNPQFYRELSYIESIDLQAVNLRLNSLFESLHQLVFQGWIRGDEKEQKEKALGQLTPSEKKFVESIMRESQSWGYCFQDNPDKIWEICARAKRQSGGIPVLPIIEGIWKLGLPMFCDRTEHCSSRWESDNGFAVDRYMTGIVNQLCGDSLSGQSDDKYPLEGSLLFMMQGREEKECKFLIAELMSGFRYFNNLQTVHDKMMAALDDDSFYRRHSPPKSFGQPYSEKIREEARREFHKTQRICQLATNLFPILLRNLSDDLGNNLKFFKALEPLFFIREIHSQFDRPCEEEMDFHGKIEVLELINHLLREEPETSVLQKENGAIALCEILERMCGYLGWRQIGDSDDQQYPSRKFFFDDHQKSPHRFLFNIRSKMYLLRELADNFKGSFGAVIELLEVSPEMPPPIIHKRGLSFQKREGWDSSVRDYFEDSGCGIAGWFEELSVALDELEKKLGKFRRFKMISPLLRLGRLGMKQGAYKTLIANFYKLKAFPSPHEFWQLLEMSVELERYGLFAEELFKKFQSLSIGQMNEEVRVLKKDLTDTPERPDNLSFLECLNYRKHKISVETRRRFDEKERKEKVMQQLIPSEIEFVQYVIKSTHRSYRFKIQYDQGKIWEIYARAKRQSSGISILPIIQAVWEMVAPEGDGWGDYNLFVEEYMEWIINQLCGFPQSSEVHQDDLEAGKLIDFSPISDDKYPLEGSLLFMLKGRKEEERNLLIEGLINGLKISRFISTSWRENAGVYNAEERSIEEIDGNSREAIGKKIEQTEMFFKRSMEEIERKSKKVESKKVKLFIGEEEKEEAVLRAVLNSPRICQFAMYLFPILLRNPSDNLAQNVVFFEAVDKLSIKGKREHPKEMDFYGRIEVLKIINDLLNAEPETSVLKKENGAIALCKILEKMCDYLGQKDVSLYKEHLLRELADNFRGRFGEAADLLKSSSETTTSGYSASERSRGVSSGGTVRWLQKYSDFFDVVTDTFKEHIKWVVYDREYDREGFRRYVEKGIRWGDSTCSEPFIRFEIISSLLRFGMGKGDYEGFLVKFLSFKNFEVLGQEYLSYARIVHRCIDNGKIFLEFLRRCIELESEGLFKEDFIKKVCDDVDFRNYDYYPYDYPIEIIEALLEAVQKESKKSKLNSNSQIFCGDKCL